MQVRTPRIVVLALALAVVVTAVGGPLGASPMQPASAEWSSECDVSDALGPVWMVAYNTVTGNDGCRWVSGDQTDVEQLVATDAYASALALKDSADSYSATTGNFLENTRTVAYSKGKIALVNSLNNGSSVSVAKAEMNDTVEAYYSRVELEIINDWNAKMEQLDYLKSTNLTVQAYWWYDSSDKRDIAWTMDQTDYTLPNGTSVNVTFLNDGGVQLAPVSSGLNDVKGAVVQVQDPDTDEWKSVLWADDYGEIGTYAGGGTTMNPDPQRLLSNVAPQAQQVKDNLGPYADEVYNQYTAGQIDSTDLAQMDPSVIAQEASTDFQSTGYYGHAAIMLASIGASGNINVSHHVTTSDGTSLNGTLYYTGDDAPSGGFATGTQYNYSDYNGTFYFAAQMPDGNASILDLADYGQSFTIEEATNTQTGETVNTTEVHTYTYDSTNASALADEIDRLRELREQYQHQQSAAGGSSSGISNQTYILIGGAAAAALVLLGRSENGGGRRGGR